MARAVRPTRSTATSPVAREGICTPDTSLEETYPLSTSCVTLVPPPACAKTATSTAIRFSRTGIAPSWAMCLSSRAHRPSRLQSRLSPRLQAAHTPFGMRRTRTGRYSSRFFLSRISPTTRARPLITLSFHLPSFSPSRPSPRHATPHNAQPAAPSAFRSPRTTQSHATLRSFVQAPTSATTSHAQHHLSAAPRFGRFVCFLCNPLHKTSVNSSSVSRSVYGQVRKVLSTLRISRRE